MILQDKKETHPGGMGMANAFAEPATFSARGVIFKSKKDCAQPGRHTFVVSLVCSPHAGRALPL